MGPVIPWKDPKPDEFGLDTFYCAICQFAHGSSRHHLIPRSQQKGRVPIVNVCRACHDFIHARFSNKELATIYNDVEKIIVVEDVMKFVAWRTITIEGRINVKKRHRIIYARRMGRFDRSTQQLTIAMPRIESTECRKSISHNPVMSLGQAQAATARSWTSKT